MRRRSDSAAPLPANVAAAAAWFAARGWAPFDFQREVWAAMAAGDSGLLHATTGAGKTLAVWIGALQRCRPGARGLQVLWITPMRALATDTARALAQPLDALAPGLALGQRTGDTAATERARQDRRPPGALVTTPESLTLMLSRESARADLGGVHTVIVDEWHELVGSKRGVQVQLALARLKRWSPGVVVWGLSATLGNLDQAMDTLVGGCGRLVQGRVAKALRIDTLLPTESGPLSWAGHLGAQMLQPVVAEIERSATTLVFVNVRSQAERWYRLLLEARPDWAGVLALHHGSLDRGLRDWVELGLKEGRLKAVVATSSLDLGVDFLPVERVLQIGSAKGVARLLQRAGRSGHAPGRESRVTLVPTQLLEVVEAAASRRAALAGRVESRRSPDQPLDVLVQHLVTLALGGGFDAGDLFDEVRSAPAYQGLTRAAFDWALAFAGQGGASLAAYPQYHRLQCVDGLWRVMDRAIARRHRLQVGTIVSDASVQLKWTSGGRLGTVDEGFIARLSPGDSFWFGGRLLEYVRSGDLVVYVRKSAARSGVVPSWSGSRMAMSDELSGALLQLLDEAARGELDEPELRAAWPMLQAQARMSRLPRTGLLLAERHVSRDGQHLWLYPFAGRNAHLGLAGLLAWRLSRTQPNTFSIAVNDYGLELLSALPLDLQPLRDGSVLSPDGLEADLLASLNAGQLARKRFREIARIAGLVFTGYPGAGKSLRQLQASSALFFEVFAKYDPGNLLLAQARQEVLAQELDAQRLAAALRRLAAQRIELVELDAPSPFGVPLMVERLREQLSTEQLQQRLQRILQQAAAAPGAGAR